MQNQPLVTLFKKEFDEEAKKSISLSNYLSDFQLVIVKGNVIALYYALKLVVINYSASKLCASIAFICFTILASVSGSNCCIRGV